jgi:hypothetical protein
MSANALWIFLAILLTVVSWGVYGPVLHHGQATMDPTAGLTRLRPLICVGLAYFAIAVVLPLIAIHLLGVEQERQWSTEGFWWSFGGGAVGALGAIGIVIALSNGGSPSYVMPLVFGGAPVVNAIVTIVVARNFHLVTERPLFIVGLITVVVGAVLVMTNAPPPAKPHAATHDAKAVEADKAPVGTP